MKTLTLQKLTLRNFQNHKDLEINFENNTTIFGKNKSGKSTVFNAFTWLLYGKDSDNQADFDIKTLDSNNTPIHNLEHEVEGFFLINETELILKRIYKEKWTKKRGSEFSELTGHETLFFFNDVPVSKSEYENKLKEIVSEELLKIITSPLFFNTKMKWQDRRLLLSDIAGEVSNSDILDEIGHDDFDLVELLNSGKNLEDEKKTLSAKKKKIKDELDLIPSRLDEVSRNLPAVQDWVVIQDNINGCEKEFLQIDEQILDKSKGQSEQQTKISTIQAEKFAKEQQLTKLENELKIEQNKNVSQLKIDISVIENKQATSNNLVIEKTKSIEENLNRISILNAENDKLREDWTKENAIEFELKDSDRNCPTCNREISDLASKIESLKTAFYDYKKIKLDTIQVRGGRNNKEISAYQKENTEYQKQIDDSKKEFQELFQEKTKLNEKLALEEKNLESSSRSSTPEIEILKTEIEKIIIPEIAPVDVSELQTRKSELKQLIDSEKAKLNDKTAINKGNERIKELKTQQKNLSQEIASMEKIEMQIDNFNKAKINLIESRVNSKFELVKFKMFDQQMNGGENQICVCTVDGVPFGSVNTADKINAGIDIINVISKHYGVYSTIFVDNRESVTELIKTPSQIVSLIVSPEDIVLRIS